MVVAVQKGLENIKEKLREKGYDVVTFGEYNYPIDAVVYSGNSIDMSYIKNNNIPNMTAHQYDYDNSARGYGVLMVNATNKSVEDLDHMLRSRTYSPLF